MIDAESIPEAQSPAHSALSPSTEAARTFSRALGSNPTLLGDKRKTVFKDIVPLPSPLLFGSFPGLLVGAVAGATGEGGQRRKVSNAVAPKDESGNMKTLFNPSLILPATLLHLLPCRHFRLLEEEQVYHPCL
ncbi:hypothetical protein VKT23_008093 [Stygiomarasmius scandens]|uniref:Uncharacterized protein n=1 Tax=Marasmiellus scandens TaxID=2682957 RepID=A0ABR1JI60_9AGAR